MNEPLPQVTIYTDGSCNPNPGPGGWAAVLVWSDRPVEERVGSEADATNNRMELRAACEGLRALSSAHQVDLYTDSQYLRRGITQWIPLWQERGWQTRDETAIKNRDLWDRLLAEARRHRVVWHWTRGHAGQVWNERADALARSAIPAAALPLDDPAAVHVFVAASYLGKENKGGWAVLVRCGGRVETFSGGERNTSANRLHIFSALQGLQAVGDALLIHLYTVSDYVKNGATTWVLAWAAGGWLTRDGEPVSHRDLWEQLADLSRRRDVRWHVTHVDGLTAEMIQVKKLAAQAAHNV